MNSRPPAPKAGTLPSCATPRMNTGLTRENVYTPPRSEVAQRSQTMCSRGANLRISAPDPVTAMSVAAALGDLARSFSRYLRAVNRSECTVTTYAEATGQFTSYLTGVEDARRGREHWCTPRPRWRRGGGRLLGDRARVSPHLLHDVGTVFEERAEFRRWRGGVHLLLTHGWVRRAWLVVGERRRERPTRPSPSTARPGGPLGRPARPPGGRARHHLHPARRRSSRPPARACAARRVP